MAYSTVTATAGATIPASDINQLQANIEALSGTTSAPSQTLAQIIKIIEQRANAESTIWVGSQAQYDLLSTTTSTRLYFATGS